MILYLTWLSTYKKWDVHISYLNLVNYIRYINDIFIIQKGTKEQLVTFFKELKKNMKLLNLNTKLHCRKSHSLI